LVLSTYNTAQLRGFELDQKKEKDALKVLYIEQLGLPTLILNYHVLQLEILKASVIALATGQLISYREELWGRRKPAKN
jgi:hypothetical protein